MREPKEIDCPSCGGLWYNDLDESGIPYTCYRCCNGMLKCYENEMEESDGQPDEAQEWHDYDPDC